MSENDQGRARGVPTEAERARVEMTAFLLRRRPAAEGAGGYPPSPGLCCTHEGPDGREGHLVAIGPAASRLVSAFVLAPFVGPDDACELAPAFAEHFFPEGEANRTALVGIEIYNWLAAVGIMAEAPAEWHWQSIEAFAAHMVEEIMAVRNDGHSTGTKGEKPEGAAGIPF